MIERTQQYKGYTIKHHMSSDHTKQGAAMWTVYDPQGRFVGSHIKRHVCEGIVDNHIKVNGGVHA